MGLFWKGKTHILVFFLFSLNIFYILAKCHRTDLVICSHSREGNPRLKDEQTG